MIRRKFLKQVSISSVMSLIIPLKWDVSSLVKNSTNTTGPLIISTWKHGMAANERASEILEKGKRAVDAAQEGAMVVEADPTNTSVGLGGYPDRDGHVTLDACVMDEFGNAGGVMFLEGIEHPVSVARLVMDKTPHVFLAGDGALQFALENGFTQKIGLNEVQKEAWNDWLKKNNYTPKISATNHDTIGILVRDSNGNFGGACTTSGAAFKMHGRVGDSPIIGAGLFVDNEIGAAASTGLGEATIKICGSHTVVEMMRQGKSPQQACEEAVNRIISKQKMIDKDFQVAFIAVNKNGEYGAYAVQPEFQYALFQDGVNKLYDSESYISK